MMFVPNGFSCFFFGSVTPVHRGVLNWGFYYFWLVRFACVAGGGLMLWMGWVGPPSPPHAVREPFWAVFRISETPVTISPCLPSELPWWVEGLTPPQGAFLRCPGLARYSLSGPTCPWWGGRKAPVSLSGAG